MEMANRMAKDNKCQKSSWHCAPRTHGPCGSGIGLLNGNGNCNKLEKIHIYAKQKCIALAERDWPRHGNGDDCMMTT